MGRYYSEADEHADRYMPLDAVAALEAAASFPHVTQALAEINGNALEVDSGRKSNDSGSSNVNSNVVALAQRFAMLMSEYNQSISDGIITVTEAKRMLSETLELQKVLVEMKLHLEDETI